MAFAFEDLKVYQKSLDFSVNVIKVIDEIDAPRKHYRLIEQIEASSTSVASNTHPVKQLESVNKMLSGLINSI